MRRLLPLALLALFAGCSSSDDAAAPSTTPPDTTKPLVCDAAKVTALADDVSENISCALKCPAACDESDKPWTCKALAPFEDIPHDCDACGKWDGKHPTPVAGKCTASEPTGDAIAKASFDVLPDGRRLVPAGKSFVFKDKLQGTFPAAALRVPGTRFVVVTDNGYIDNPLRVIDTMKLAAGEPAEVSSLNYPPPLSLSMGLALTKAGTLYAASGAPDSVVRAYKIDTTTGALSEDKAKDIPIKSAADPKKGIFPLAMAMSPDEKVLVVGQVKESDVYVVSLEAATYGQVVKTIKLPGIEHVALSFDPASSDVVYASLWLNQALAEITLSTGAVRKIDVGRAPEELAFLDANFVAVAESLSDDIAIVDRAKGTVALRVPVDTEGALHGDGPSALAFDQATSRLYVTLSGENAVLVMDVQPSMGPGIAPKLAPLGKIPTAWWPTEVLVAGPGDPEPGSLFVLNGKGHGTGPVLISQGLNNGLIGEAMHGSAQHVPAPGTAEIATYDAAWKAASKPKGFAGASTVTCPDGAPYDFPIPKTNTEGPSKLIDRVVFVVRENKTFDDVLGDMPGMDGDPKLVMAPGKMDEIWPNYRAAVKAFATSDNFYEDAEQSIQGHFWTAFGRASDHLERTWLYTWGRGTRGPLPVQGVAESTWPEEGGIFTWLKKNNVAFDNMGELIANTGLDTDYGTNGLVSTSATVPDTKFACYMATRARVKCDMKSFSYAWFPNDHTFGGAAGKPNPAVMIAVSDEATGMLLDALSHSPKWKSTLLVVVEDDPQDGADHVDAHRSIILLASPWVKRGYVSKTHMDIPSVHKIFAHVFGIPYNNKMVEDAAMPFDIFTSTPDYTPFSYIPRKWKDLSCNAKSTSWAEEAEDWDFSEPDEQPGLGRQVREMLRQAK